jgi:acyl-CoA thioester hydrolase
MPREYRMQRRVQFSETDAARLVHFSNFFRYMEDAEHALWRDAGMSISSADRGIGWPRVAASFDYHRPLHFEDEFEVSIRIVTLASRTIKYACEITKDGEKIATGSLTIACVRRVPGEPMRATEIPPDIAARLSSV